MRLHVLESGDGVPVVLLHGLTATHRYVVMGSKALERSGHRVVAYDARGHGRSDPPPAGEGYGYEALTADLVRVMDEREIARAVLVGASMGAHTVLRLALERPERVAGLVAITPSYDPDEHDDPRRLVAWDTLADGLRRGGVDGFLAAYGTGGVGDPWRETIVRVVRQRLSLHEHPDAVADALREVPRSRPFADVAALEAVAVPTVVVADHDEPDPGHPLRVGEAYAAAIPGARLVVEEPGRSPIAWQGAQLSRIVEELAAQVRV
jgi:pimeloyl-ACP methyl ester carboxylesterase